MIKLKKGDIVDIIAPASFSDPKELIAAVKEISKWGLVPRTFINFKANHPFHSDDDHTRLHDLKRALLVKDSKAIWCLRGGYGSARLLEELSKMKKPAHKKILIGFSDITALHAFLNQKWKWETIHGPTISSFSKINLQKKCILELKNILLGVHKNDFKLKPINESAKDTKSKIEGAVIGGNLAIIQSLLGTNFQLKTKNKILVIEDVNERGFRIDRMLKHLEMAGMLKGCSAIVFGDFTKALEPNGASYVDYALNRFARDLKIPVFKTNEFGHGKINRPLIFNGNYQIKNKTLVFSKKASH
jgi:muramoyltetrapeptide carboxypeptidase